MNKYYKTPLLFWFSMLLLILVAASLTGCGKKPIINGDNKETVDISRIEVSKFTERNRAINDQFTLFIPKVFTGKPECDSVTQATLDNVLSQINAQKNSGDNSYKLGYDAAKREFTMQTNIGATENVNESKSDARIFVVKQKTTVTVTKTPEFMKYSAYAGWLFVVLIIFKAYKKLSTLWLPKPLIS